MSSRWIGVLNYLKWKANSSHRKRAFLPYLDEMKFKPEDIVVINLLVVATKI
jgi:hypothetical protein